MTTTGTRVKRLMIAWLAVTAVILTTACSKNGGGGEQPKPQATPPPSAPATNGRTNGSELNGNSGRSAQTHDGTSVTTPESTNGSGMDPTVTYFDPTGLTPDQIFASSSNSSDGGSAGLQSEFQDSMGHSLIYSGAGQDDLREQLWARVNSVQDPQQRAADESLARELGLATYTVDWNTRTMRISILQVQNGHRRQLNFDGVLDNNLLARFGDLQSSPYIAAEAACMDLNGGCNTIHIKVMENQNGVPRNAHIIARNSNATLFTEGNGYGLASNPEYDRLLGVMLNTVHSPGATETVKKLALETSETINGSSNFLVSMKIKTASPLHPQGGEQLLVWTGPLVKPTNSNRLDLMLTAAPSYNTVGGQPVVLQGLISDTIRDTRLVRNDGHGNLQLAVTVRKSTATAKEDTMVLTVARIHKPVKNLVLR